MGVCVKQQIASNLEFLQKERFTSGFRAQKWLEMPPKRLREVYWRGESTHILLGGHKHKNWSVLGANLCLNLDFPTEQSITCGFRARKRPKTLPRSISKSGK